MATVDSAIRIGIVGDFDERLTSHQATATALNRLRTAQGLWFEHRWLSLDSPSTQADAMRCHGLWIAPGPPPSSMDVVLDVIRFARESSVPLLATCGGCQLALIEFARHVAGLCHAQHAETEPDGDELAVVPLGCSLVGQRRKIGILQDSKLSAAYGGQRESMEDFRCRFGLNPLYASRLEEEGLKTVARDENGEPRAWEVENHPFYALTLYVPQMSAQPHPLVAAFVNAALRFSQSP